MMKLLYILKSFANKAGTERVFSDKINYLAQRGYDITLITYEQGSHSYAFPLSDLVHHVDLDTRFFKVSQQPLLKRPFYKYRLRRLFLCRFQQIVDEISPDVIICTTYSFPLLDIISSVKTNAYRIVESHVACFTIRKSFEYRLIPVVSQLLKLYDAYQMSCLKHFEKLIVLTEGDASEWRKYMPRVEVISNPVTFYPEKVLTHEVTKKRIICVGRLHVQKGFDMLIDAFSLIASRCPQWHIDIYGSGDDEVMLRQMIVDRNLEKRIIIHEPSDDIYKEYQTSDFLVLSSRYEGFGLVLAEAMSCGIPCVAFKCKYGPDDVLTDGDDGFLVENGNVKELAGKMLWMIEHKEERLRMGVKAREKAKKYQIDLIMKRWETLFNSFQKESQ